jgi:class 3 adenylate cyclase
VLAADVVGSTALVEVIDPEESRVVFGDAVRHVISAVEAYGGTIKHLAGGTSGRWLWGNHGPG